MKWIGSAGFRQCRFQSAARSARILLGFPITIVNGGLKLGFDFAIERPFFAEGNPHPRRVNTQLAATALAF